MADGVNADLLKEYGLTDFESGTYTAEDGRKVALKAIRFADASGAYGAFTYYKLPQMRQESIPDLGSSLNERVLFYRGNILVDAVFEKLTAMSAASLRELSQALPLPVGNAGNLPSLPAYLPKSGYVKNTAKYVMGPVGLDKIGAPLTAQLVDFNASAEVALGAYQTSSGVGTLMLIAYPTPQLATGHLQALEAAQAQNAKEPGSVPALAAGQIFTKRTGPLLVLVAGSGSRDQVQSLLASVNYEANVTWNEKNPFDKRGNIGTIVVNALLLSGVVAVLALIAGLAFGGVRVLMKKLFPNTSMGRPDETEFIALHLEEAESKGPDVRVS